MTKQEAFNELRGSLTGEQNTALRSMLTMPQLLKVPGLTADNFKAFHDGLTAQQKEHFAAIVLPSQRQWVDILLDAAEPPPAVTAPPPGQSSAASSSAPARKGANALLLESVVDAIPKHLKKGPGGPWRITRPVFDAYFASTGKSEADIKDDGRDVALWLMRQNLSKVGGRLQSALLAYMGGWGAVREGSRSKWFPLVRDILADAGQAAHDEPPIEVPGLTVTVPRRKNPLNRGSPWYYALWAASSFATLAFLSGRKARKEKR